MADKVKDKQSVKMSTIMMMFSLTEGSCGHQLDLFVGIFSLGNSKIEFAGDALVRRSAFRQC